MSIPNTTYRVLVEKLGDSDPSTFVGNEGEVFYDPNNPTLKLSDGLTVGGVSIGGTGGGGEQSLEWVKTDAGIHTTSNVGIGTTNARFLLEVGSVGSSGTSLYVNGDARITGILTVGSSSITFDGNTNTITVGTGVTINGDSGSISAMTLTIGEETLSGLGVTSITAGSGISIDQSTGNVTITSTGGGGTSDWVRTDAGIHTLGNVGIGTTNPTTALTINGTLGFPIFTGAYNGVSGVNISIGDTTTGANIIPNADSNEAINNILIGVGAGNSITTGRHNYFIGHKSGYFTDSGYYNKFFGYYSGYYNTSGQDNIMIGDYSGYYNTTGVTNTIVGDYAGFYNTTGDSNTFIGRNAGCRNTTGRGNNYFGRSAGAGGQTASYNIALGSYAGSSYNDTGESNVFVGNYSGSYNETGCQNSFFGNYSGQRNTTGRYNANFGNCSGYCNTTGSFNTVLGGLSGFFNQTGSFNIFVGSQVGNSQSISASRKILIGAGTTFGGFDDFDAPSPTKDYQFAVGFKTTTATSSRYWLVGDENFNIGIGTTNPQVRLQIGGVLGFGVYDRTQEGSPTNPDLVIGTNILIGDNTTGPNLDFGSTDYEGMNNIFIGVGAGSSATTTYGNHFIGKFAGRYTTTGSANNFFGVSSGRNNTTGFSNNFFGLSSGHDNTTGTFNVFFGTDSGYYNTIGGNNSFFGASAGFYHINGNYNSFFGSGSGLYNQNGSHNTFLGSYNGISTSASYKILIGSGESWGNNFDSPDITKDTQLAIGVRTDSNDSKYWLIGDENFNVGIGTTNPTSKLTVGGDIKVGINTSQGIILSSPNGTTYRLIVDDSGVLSTTLT